ncbi:MAG: hypothetical protein LEGION0398_MBIBDBAK_00923 [Legionellaceae bacterium]
MLNEDKQDMEILQSLIQRNMPPKAPTYFFYNVDKYLSNDKEIHEGLKSLINSSDSAHIILAKLFI